MKSTVEEIRKRFDGDVERFSNLETGQSATIDAPLVLDLVTKAAAAATPGARRVLDVGCGAGNYTLKLMQEIGNVEATLVDLSRPMLDRAAERIVAAGGPPPKTIQGDIRELRFADGEFDVIVAAAVLHHLRSDDEWELVFGEFYQALSPGGGVWISDLIEHGNPRVQALMWERYGQYLAAFRDEKYREDVFAYIAQEDSPRPLMYQVDLLRRVGFGEVDILHKNSVFAAFGAIKSPQ